MTVISKVPLQTYEEADEFIRVGRAAVRNAQEESRRMGVPNVYSINGIIYFELPNGELSREDPWHGSDTNPNAAIV
jgi:hypothetical protein